MSEGQESQPSTYNRCDILWRVMLFRHCSKLNLGIVTIDAYVWVIRDYRGPLDRGPTYSAEKCKMNLGGSQSYSLRIEIETYNDKKSINVCLLFSLKLETTQGMLTKEG
jgi:hypothetical protein